jgi:diamine N-acetyltransferase
MTIVVATKEQLPIVQELAVIIWPDTYGKILSNEQFDYMMEMMYSIQSLEKQLQNNKIFLLAEDENRFVGFAPYEVNNNNSNKTKIHKLYVLPETQGKGIGKKLIDFITDIAITNHNSILNLTVNKNNKAKDFYLKNGFEITEEAVFDIGNGYVMDDYVMEKKIL